MTGEKNRTKITVRDIALIGVMTAIIEVSKLALSFLPNVELVSFWMILFSIVFGWRILFVVPVFVLIEGSIYGFGLWWVMYLYIWPLLAILARLFRRHTNVCFWSCFSGIFGLLFGLLCALPYVVIGTGKRGILGGLYAGFTWWVAGIPWDILHGISNFVLMWVLYRPMRAIMSRLQKQGLVSG